MKLELVVCLAHFRGVLAARPRSEDQYATTCTWPHGNQYSWGGVSWHACCVPRTTDWNWCACIPQEESFSDTTDELPKYDAYAGWIERKAVCCARIWTGDYGELNYPLYHYRAYDNEATETCGCIPNGVSWKGEDEQTGSTAENSCCSGEAENGPDYHCKARSCKQKGSTFTSISECCRGQHPGKIPHTPNSTDTNKCGCLHKGEIPFNDGDDVTEAHCCSGSVDMTGKCRAIPAGGSLEHGAVETDCESEELAEDGKCKQLTCTSPGQPLDAGGHCCSGESNAQSGSVCGCVASGQSLPANASLPADALCCSGSAAGGTCQYLAPGFVVDTDRGASSSTCSSGESVTRDNSSDECTCSKPGVSLPASVDVTHCCSGEVTGGHCTCLPNGHFLSHGAAEEDCCSQQAVDGHCVCALGGRLKREGGNGEECCVPGPSTSTACGCGTTNSTQDDSRQCCSQRRIGGKCRCIPAGTIVATYVDAESCCSGTKGDDNKCT